MIEYFYRHRVRYREADPMGLVYHVHYADYFEAARTEMLRELGLAYKQLEESGILMPVVDLRIRYKRPAYYDDELEILTRVREVPETRVTIDYEVRRTDENELLADGQVTLCFVDSSRYRPVRAPDRVRELFSNALESSESA